GGYGLVASLSRLAGRNLLPSVEDETRLIQHTVDMGAVDGTTGEQKYYVGFRVARYPSRYMISER
ncbi:MAG: DUF4392 domain-containing protein, partial [Planctomycetes bacterium]|nr:DUF4392 domain-containing protein [Planctomycetota bacterium]